MTHLLLAALFATVGTVRGTVILDSAPLPGCTVRLTSAAGEWTRVADANGAYRFEGVPPGKATLRFELEGVQSAERSITVDGGDNVRPTEKLQLSETKEEIVLTCGMPCSSRSSSSVWALPSCADYDLDTALIESMERGDRSAIALLRERHDREMTFSEKHRLAAAFLGRVSDDTPYWNELSVHAANAIRWSGSLEEPTDEFVQWCAAHDYDPAAYGVVTLEALRLASADRRSLPMLRDALKTGNELLVSAAVQGFAMQHDESALPAIARALEVLDGHTEWIAMALAMYQSEAADRIALKYIDESEREDYAQARRGMTP